MLIQALRKQVDMLLLQHLENPQGATLDSPVVPVMLDLLAKDGF